MATHAIQTAADLDLFLLGELGTNTDNFVLENSFTAGATIRTGRGHVNGIPFMGSFDGQGNTITGLQIRPRNAAETTVTPDFNDFGFIRAAGSGAIIQNINFDNL